MNFQMFKLVLEKAEEPEIKLPKSIGSWKKQESSRKTSISALLTMPKPLTVSVSSVASHSLRPHGLQHTKPLCPSPTPSLPKLTSIESVMPSYHLILCCPLLLQPPIFPSIRVFSNESDVCIRCPKYWSISFSISPSSEYPGLISFRMDWLDLLSVQSTLESLLQHPSSKISILQCSAFFTVQLSHPYMTTLTSTHNCVDHHKL